MFFCSSQKKRSLFHSMFFVSVKCEGVVGAENDVCIKAVLKEIIVEIGKPGKNGITLMTPLPSSTAP
jgi:hypothetical protein